MLVNRRNSGFTLMEILAVISIAAVFANLSDQTAGSFYSSQNVAANAQIFIQDVRYGRSGAINDQVYYRLFITYDATGCIASYTVQSYPNSTVSSGDLSDSINNVYSASWTNTLDFPYREFPSAMSVTVGTSPSVIFFRPDGLLVSTPSQDSLPIPEYTANFTDGVTSFTVMINAAGVIESDEWYED
ncbi:MAG: prepilin-type N-terminal cleavage/methylation domain-containing protein [Candidatus Riflebacteria bacterium]|nr:prepilin-type N-terminal cleavage/methylation domain-containing protein [Candidatus Riflebacteria bacterium]